MDMPGPSIIIAGSGMLTGGRMVAHLEQGLTDSRNDILFVGYQAKGTPGRAVLEQAGRKNSHVRLGGREIPICAEIHSLSGFSAHADQAGLLSFVDSIPGKPGIIKLVHGESEARRALKHILDSKGYLVD
jgi:metallo-beta-lactamase family protein